MKLHEVARVVVDTIARVAPERHLTRIMVSEDQIGPAYMGWWRVAIGEGVIGVTEALSPDRIEDEEDMRIFMEHLFVRLDHALAQTSVVRETRLDSAAE